LLQQTYIIAVIIYYKFYQVARKMSDNGTNLSPVKKYVKNFKMLLDNFDKTDIKNTNMLGKEFRPKFCNLRRLI